MPFWESDIVPAIRNGNKVLVVAHGNSLRAIVQHLSNISEKGRLIWNIDITTLNIPTSIPLVYEFDENMKATKHFYLADPEELEAQINKVKKQTGKWYSFIILSNLYSIYS